jgi:hypothetical protein
MNLINGLASMKRHCVDRMPGWLGCGAGLPGSELNLKSSLILNIQLIIEQVLRILPPQLFFNERIIDG